MPSLLVINHERYYYIYSIAIPALNAVQRQCSKTVFFCPSTGAGCFYCQSQWVSASPHSPAGPSQSHGATHLSAFDVEINVTSEIEIHIMRVSMTYIFNYWRDFYIIKSTLNLVFHRFKIRALFAYFSRGNYFCVEIYNCREWLQGGLCVNKYCWSHGAQDLLSQFTHWQLRWYLHEGTIHSCWLGFLARICARYSNGSICLR